nr:RNA-directed DNA polymerase, eukaryota [Tanacetum cinerariifolium]
MDHINMGQNRHGRRKPLRNGSYSTKFTHSFSVFQERNSGAISLVRKKKQALFFKVDFAKAYDSIRWDYHLDVLEAFGFGSTWCSWIRGTLNYAKASILVNGSPSKEFSFHRGLKQRDPLAPYLFIQVMESLHLSFLLAIEAGLFKGIQLSGSLSVSHLFYADDAMFLGEWSERNLSGIINILKCFYLASGLYINIHKSQLLGVGVPHLDVEQATSSIGYSIMLNQFQYLGVKVVRAMYGDMIESHPTHISSIWWSILRELHVLKGKGFYFWSHCKKRIGNGSDTRF